MAVKILTDSGADFTRDEAAQLGVEIVPVYLTYGAERLRDGIEIDSVTFHRRMSAGEVPDTDPASVEDYRSAYERALNAGNDVVIVTLSSVISKSYERAATAAADFSGKVHVVDSRGASGLECLLAQLALERAAAGDSAEAIAKRIDPANLKHGIFFAVPTMAALERSGRIPKAVIALGSMLNVSLLLKMNDAGAIAPAGQSFSFDKTLDLMVEAVVRTVDRNPQARFAVAHVDAGDTANMLSGLLEKKLGHPPIQLTVRGSALTIATHLGKGAIGIYAVVS